jgi:hypothetical protein
LNERIIMVCERKSNWFLFFKKAIKKGHPYIFGCPFSIITIRNNFQKDHFYQIHFYLHQVRFHQLTES